MRILFLLAVWIIGTAATAADLPQLKVSDNKRFLVTEANEPFFWLGDTAWELFHRLNREDAAHYLDQRQRLGFNVIQAVAIAELNGPAAPNAYGHLPFENLNPTEIAIKDGPDNDYWDHVDWVVDEANKRGMYVGFLPTWGSYWHEETHEGKVLFDAENARNYAKWLGARYRDKGLIWILGGDRTIDTDNQRQIIEAMAAGLREGDGGKHLITFHPRGGSGSSKDFHNADWLDFNMRQNGHSLEFTNVYSNTRNDFNLTPIKPVLDGEPIYEDHPIAFKANAFGHSVSADVRRPLYWNVFSGACGHTYGHHSIWQMYSSNKDPINNPLMPWNEAIDQPGAAQMQHCKNLVLSRPYLDRIPADDVVANTNIPTSIPGTGTRAFVATRDTARTYAFVYCPVGRAVTIDLESLVGPSIVAWWFDPRTGVATKLDEPLGRKGKHTFRTPTHGELLDWVLVLDSTSKAYGIPGQVNIGSN